MNGLRTWFAAAWQHLIAVQARDEEEARLGRLFNTMMVISLGIVAALSIDFLLLHPLGLVGASLSWTAAAFPLALIPLSVFCLAQARREFVNMSVLLIMLVSTVGRRRALPGQGAGSQPGRVSEWGGGGKVREGVKQAMTGGVSTVYHLPNQLRMG